MIESDRFIKFVQGTFSFLVTELKMKYEKETINGNIFYDIHYRDKDKVISISLETIENYFQVILFKLHGGQMPDYDDKTKTIHLNKLNQSILKTVDKTEFADNNNYFGDIRTEDETERMILKSAKDLRICLKYYDR